MNKFVKFVRDYSMAAFFLPAGLLLIIFSIFAFLFVDKTKDYTKTEATVSKTILYERAYTDEDDVHHDATYRVFVKYTVDGRVYNEEYGVFSNYKEGDKLTVKYNPDNPSEVVQPNTIILPICLLIGGVAATIFSIISIISTNKKNKKFKLQEEAWTDGN